MSSECHQQAGDGHTSPCPWSKAMMWAAGASAGAAIFVFGNIFGRMSALEKVNGDTREALAGLRATTEYVARDVSDIKASLRREEVARKIQ